MKRKVVMSALCVLCCVMLASCGRNKGNENKDPLTGEDQTEQSSEESSSQEGSSSDESGDEFGSMLNDESTDANGIMDYINTNIATAGESDIRRFFTGLLSFGEDIRDIDFTQLDESRQYMPEDMIAFMELMKLEAESPSMVMSDEENRRVIGLTLSEMLERALLYEQHIEKYQNEASTDAAVRLYEEIATQAITGGYDKSAGIEHYYKGDSADQVDQESLQYYQQFAEANPDSNLGAVVQEYITVLQQNQFQISENLEEFYHSLYEKLVIDTTQGNEVGDENGTSTGSGSGTGSTGSSSTSGGSTGSTGNTGDTNGSGSTGNGSTNGSGSTNGGNSTGSTGSTSETGSTTGSTNRN